MLYILMYLAAIVLANLSVVMFGPSITVANAFVFVGLDLVARDKLHDAWHGNYLWLKMAALIATGSVLSWLVNRDAGQIALASFVAFGLAGIADTITYHLLRNRAWWQRVNGSNVVSAAVDSIAFPTIAFGALLPAIIIGQFAAKVAGGAVWSAIIGWIQQKRVQV